MFSCSRKMNKRGIRCEWHEEPSDEVKTTLASGRFHDLTTFELWICTGPPVYTIETKSGLQQFIGKCHIPNIRISSIVFYLKIMEVNT